MSEHNTVRHRFPLITVVTHSDKLSEEEAFDTTESFASEAIVCLLCDLWCVRLWLAPPAIPVFASTTQRYAWWALNSNNQKSRVSLYKENEGIILSLSYALMSKLSDIISDHEIEILRYTCEHQTLLHLAQEQCPSLTCLHRRQTATLCLKALILSRVMLTTSSRAFCEVTHANHVRL